MRLRYKQVWYCQCGWKGARTRYMAATKPCPKCGAKLKEEPGSETQESKA